MNSGKSKEENEDQETIHFQNAIYRVLHEISNITASFAELVKSWRINNCYTYTSGKQWGIKMEKLDTIHSEIGIHCFPRKNNTGSFAGSLKFQEKSAFTHLLWVDCSK